MPEGSLDSKLEFGFGQAALGPERVEVRQGAFVEGFGGDGQMEEAVQACEGADACILFLGGSAINLHWQEGFSQQVHQASQCLYIMLKSCESC